MLVAQVIFGGTITENKQIKKPPFFESKSLTIFKGKTWSRRWVKTTLTVLSDPQKVLRRTLTKEERCSSAWTFPYRLPSFSSVGQNWKCKCPLYTHPPTLKGESQSIPHNLSFPFKTGPVLYIHDHIKNILPEACISCCAIMSSRPSCQLGGLEHRYLIVNYKAEYFILLFFLLK